jgi:nifR3 family TIM-barrel protein
MSNGFWEKLERPFFTLAPMADVTDAAFRRIIAKFGKPDVAWTEFVSTDGLCSRGRDALLPDLWFTDAERPIVAQIFGATPAHFRETASLIADLGFDGIDINMGCPDRNVEKQHAGAAMMKDPELAQAVIRATQEGSHGLPVSVKTRIGYNKVEIDEWLPKILATHPAALTVHARTRKEMSDVPARWEYVARAVALRDQYSPETLIIGNGDVADLTDAHKKVSESGADGAMIGRGIFGNPWRFNPNIRIEDIPLERRLEVMVEHTRLFEELLGEVKNFAIMKKHYKAYVNGFDGAKELRTQLMDTISSEQVEALVRDFLSRRG